MDPFRSTRDRLLFLQARGVLAGLCGCAQSRAAQALLSVAARQGVPSSQIGEQFLAALEAEPDRESCANLEAEHLVISIVEAALSAGASDQRERDSRSVLPRRPLRFRRFVIPDERAWGLIVEGELDVATGPSLQEAVERLGRQDAPFDREGSSLLLDLRAVTFIDPSGANALKRIHAYVAAQGVRLHVTPPTGAGPRRLLQYAVKTGWLALPFAPVDPTQPLVDDVGTPAPLHLPARHRPTPG